MFKLFMFTKYGKRGGEVKRLHDALATFAGTLGGLAGIRLNEVLSCVDRLGTVSKTLEDPRFDYIGELEFATADSMLTAWRTLRDFSAPGLPSLLDRQNSRLIATEVFVQRDLPIGDDPRIQFVPVREMPGGSRQAFHKHWFGHGPLILENVPGLRGYLQNHTPDAVYREDPDAWGGVAQFWFDSVDAVAALPDTHPMNFARIVQDELAFLGPVPIENYIALPIHAMSLK